MNRPEYPRPHFQRKEWLNLNGTWKFAFDDRNEALAQHWESGFFDPALEIQVPFCYESPASGLGIKEQHDRMFYQRDFSIPEHWTGQRIMLHFGAVDYYCRIFVDGWFCREHEGGSLPFSVDITDYLSDDNAHSLSVYVEDPLADQTIPRGKQYWLEQGDSIWYTRTSGIWQTVWMEPIANAHISHIKLTPDVDEDAVLLEVELDNSRSGSCLEVHITYENETVCADRFLLTGGNRFSRKIYLGDNDIFRTSAHEVQRCWSPENPALYEVSCTLTTENKVMDTVNTYFGMRKIHTEGGITYLNNHPYYFRLVLDQGYWPQGLLTAPDDEAFQYDIKMMKEMGFNGCRKHQKSEDPRFLYWADRLGFLVWSEVPAACIFSDKSIRRFTDEWIQMIRRDYNHPSIIAWVPFNESWGVPHIKNNPAQQSHTNALYHTIKSLDQSRLAVNNDGWEQTTTDICAIHNYMHGLKEERGKREFFTRFTREASLLFSPYPAGRSIFADNHRYTGQPILITEFGGISYQSSDQEDWGYTQANSEEDFLEQYRFVVSSILQSDLIYGFCYTQLSDVEQETNGLLTYDRKPKTDPAVIREINCQYRNNIALIPTSALKQP